MIKSITTNLDVISGGTNCYVHFQNGGDFYINMDTDSCMSFACYTHKADAYSIDNKKYTPCWKEMNLAILYIAAYAASKNSHKRK